MGIRYRTQLAPQMELGRPSAKELGPHEAVLEFVAFLYEYVRDDAGMVRLLDRALKERYGKD